MNEQTIFTAALERQPSDRPAFLDEACGTDNRLRERVEKLLRLHDDAGSFLESPAAESSPTVSHPVTEKPGDTIGPYKLMEQIGEGGMGVVYMAEQSEPVDRRVALKIIKPGMDTQQVIGRFEAERQALAAMDHPNIAKVLDGGTTDSGRPYFVMELVSGIPITEFCDQQHLDVPHRLELFADLCHAVQHAHQKGIIHRDIKPSNVLVTLYDGRPVPKVIDFGVAKAIRQTLTETTIFTQLGQIVGTLEYMSPEQADPNQTDIDTRSDIYSLGVLLYELLTGETPFERRRLRSAAFDEIMRIIREEEPPRPSHRLSSSHSLTAVAANRHIEPRKLSTLVHGELDWIVMKALEKDRVRRYETANGLAADVGRYLSNEPVEAGPPSVRYRFSKFVRRNRALIVTASLIFVLLLAGIAGTAWQAHRAMKERRRTETALEQSQTIVDLLVDEQGDLDKTRELLETAVEVQRRVLGDEHPHTLHSIDNLATVLRRQGNLKDARELCEQVIEKRRRVLGEEHPHTLDSMQNLADVLIRQGNLEDARELYELVVEKRRRVLGEDPGQIWAMGNLAVVSELLGDLEEFNRVFEEALDICQRHFGDEHRWTLMAMNRVAWTLVIDADQPFADAKRAVKLASHAVEFMPEAANFRNTLGVAHYRAGNWTEAVEALEQSLELQPVEGPAYDFCFLAMAHWQLGHREEARRFYDQAVAWIRSNDRGDREPNHFVRDILELRRFIAEAAELLRVENPFESVDDAKHEPSGSDDDPSEEQKPDSNSSQTKQDDNRPDSMGEKDTEHNNID